MNKNYFSNVEDNRLGTEEPSIREGSFVVTPRLIWRDAKLIPNEPPSESLLEDLTFLNIDEQPYTAKCYQVSDGETRIPIVEYLEKALLIKVEGTENVYRGSSKRISNIILRAFGEGYEPKLYLDDDLLPFDWGEQVYDVGNGLIKFGNKDLYSKIQGHGLRITCYRYIGRTGFIGDDVAAGIPFRDELPLVKDSEYDDRTFSLLARGEIKHTNYEFPIPDGRTYVGEDNRDGDGVVLVEENLNENLWQQGIIDDGIYMSEDGTAARR